MMIINCIKQFRYLCVTACALLVVMFVLPFLNASNLDEAADSKQISYYNQIRPIFQTNCHGCHQPAKAKGKYVMTDFNKLVNGGDSGDLAIVPKQPDESTLFHSITPIGGEADMPKGKPPLSEADRKLIETWIKQGAHNDTPANVRQRYSPNNPPKYSRPPVITSIDFDPSGKLIAVAGFHEVLLVESESGKLAGRLIGISERIESVRFSPKGDMLAVTGGLPGRMGEVQIWDVAKKELKVSVPVTFDTVYGASWSPDGKYVSFGCGDNTLRAVEATTGKQVLFQGAHSDWVLDTVFSVEGKHVVSVGRDMTIKLTEFATQRFVDNVTSITPGALKGGVQAVDRHPMKNEIVSGGSDGSVKIYRMHRTSARKIGDDANKIRVMQNMIGRVFDVAVSRDGKRVAAVSSLDGEAQVNVYEYDTGKVLSSKRYAQGGLYSVAFHPDNTTIAISGADGIVRLIQSDSGSEIRTVSPAPVEKAEIAKTQAIEKVAKYDFIRDVNPILSRLGCNQGTCHGSLNGKNGFKLSLRGYDALFDTRAFTDDHASRRTNIASPDDSLMLLKATGAVPHEGGQLVKQGDPYYQIIRGWIAAGAKLNLDTPKVTRIELSPSNPVLAKAGEQLPFKVIAFYTDGLKREVTREAFIETGNADVAKVNKTNPNVVTTQRRGEAPILARYEGAYVATTLTVMGDRKGFEWEQPETWSRADEFVASKWNRMKIQPSGLSSDEEFLRRIYLDLTGLPPTADQVKAFLADKRPTRDKRDALIESLVGNDSYVEHWSNKWADLLQVNSKFLAREGATAFRAWIREEVKNNVPYDVFVKKIVTATGSNKDNPAASYYKILRDADMMMENTTHLFLGVRFNCNKCHDHPFERWTQDQYYNMAAYFAQVGLKADPASGKRKIGGTAVEGAKPLYEIVEDKKAGDIKHERTGNVAPPVFPYDCNYPQEQKDPTRRELLAAWITSPDNQYFARSYVNRLWGYLTGVGIIEPIDDIRAGNPPTNPELLDYLTDEFIKSKFNVQHIVKLICKSRTYQLSFRTNKWNEDDKINYSHALPRRLPAEVLYDSIYHVMGAKANIPGVPAGTRAAALPDVGIKLPSGFLDTFGRPARESSCECERINDLQLGSVMAMISGPAVARAVGDPNNHIVKLVNTIKDDRTLINEVYLNILNRNATDSEIKAVLNIGEEIENDHKAILAARDQRKSVADKIRNEKEAARMASLEKAKKDLAEYQKSIAAAQAAKEKQRNENIAKAEMALKAFEDNLVKQQEAWEKTQQGVNWEVVVPSHIDTSNKSKITVEKDGVVRASLNGKPNLTTLSSETKLNQITGVRLEALSDPKLPSKGPGLAPNGNFVLTEFELFYAPKSDPKKLTKLKLVKPIADFSQSSHVVANAIDNKRDGNLGWAIHPQAGKTHWATFTLDKPLIVKDDILLVFKLDSRYNDHKHHLGKYRISVTNHDKTIGLSHAGDISNILATDPAKRTDAQKKSIKEFFLMSDTGLKKHRDMVANAKKPLPVDPGVIQRQQVIKRYEVPTPPDAILAELEKTLVISTNQIKQKRLTMVQDLSWALVNSPAFLYNH